MLPFVDQHTLDLAEGFYHVIKKKRLADDNNIAIINNFRHPIKDDVLEFENIHPLLIIVNYSMKMI